MKQALRGHLHSVDRWTTDGRTPVSCHLMSRLKSDLMNALLWHAAEQMPGAGEDDAS